MSIRRDVGEGVPVARISRKYGISRQSVYNVARAASSVAPPNPGAAAALELLVRSLSRDG